MKRDINFNLTKYRITAVLFVQLLHRYLIFRQHSTYDTGFRQTFGSKYLSPLIHWQPRWFFWEKMYWLPFSKKE